MLLGFLLGIVHDRQLMWEAQVNIAIRWFIGYGPHEVLPDHSSLTRIRQRWGAERFRKIFERKDRACAAAKIAKGEIIHVDASLIRTDVGWESLAERHIDAVEEANADTCDAERTGRSTGKYRRFVSRTRTPRWQRRRGTTVSSRPTSNMQSLTTYAALFLTLLLRQVRSTRGKSLLIVLMPRMSPLAHKSEL